jgi:hypothetical protein
MRVAESEEIDDLLIELDQNLKRLRMEYEQFFMGSAKREPQQLRSKVQKVITKLVNEPPRNSRQKFRFNTLNSKFQVYRQLWGRTVREMEAGTYKRDRFKASLRSRGPDEPVAAASPEKRAPRRAGTGVDQLYAALQSARKKTGESGGGVSQDDLQRVLRKQMDAIRAKHGDVKVKFKVVIENNKAKVKAAIKSR